MNFNLRRLIRIPDSELSCSTFYFRPDFISCLKKSPFSGKIYPAMQKVVLHISSPAENRKVTLEDEVTIGRTNASQVVLDDTGLSRKNTTFFRDGGNILVADENSTNGTFVNGERISGAAVKLYDGDKINIGSETSIRVEVESAGDEDNRIKNIAAETPKPVENKSKAKNASPKPQGQNSNPEKLPFALIASIASVIAIIFFGAIIFFIARAYEGNGDNGNRIRPTAQINAKAAIPIRVIDPLGGEDPDDIDDLISSWEVEEEPLQASDIEEIKTVSTNTPSQPTDLKVPVEFWQAQMDKARNHVGVNEPLKPLLGGGIGKQKTKLGELISSQGYKQPLDFADLAELHIKGTLVELPIATESYVLDVGGSATKEEFKSFEWGADGQAKVGLIAPGSPKYQILQQLANDFYGQKYDLNNGDDRKKMRMRLLRMYNPNSRKLFEELCKAYSDRFHVPLRISSLIRSMDYQILLNKSNANSFRVSAQNALAPHTSGCAFDLPRSTLSSGEQNFLMDKIIELENVQKLDSIMEGGTNACFHTFIYPDGLPPQGQQQQSKKQSQPPKTQPQKSQTPKPQTTKPPQTSNSK